MISRDSCPKCGSDRIGKGRIDGEYIDQVQGFKKLRYLFCSDCGFESKPVEGTPMDAIKQWNRRVSSD